MTDVERKAAAKQFSADWIGRGDEKQETQLFWISLLQNVFGVEQPTKAIEFELPVKLSHTSYIDAFIGETKVLIEQKGMNIDLKRGYKQSDGSILSPFQQARRYAGYLPHNQNPRWIVVCNFQEFHIHDMNRPNDPPEIVKLSNLATEYSRLQFLVDTGDEHIRKEMEVSLKAGDLVGKLYEALLKQYKDPNAPETLKSLNALCVRLVFCLYAEDAGIFGGHNKFHDYMNEHKSEDRRALINLFKVLDTKPEERDPYMDADLAAFPYVNGGLFADESIIIPRLGTEIVDLILNHASADFDWSAISPTIFGAVFESTLNPETRRSGGMHYTSIENIHKVIDPLFLDDLNAEFTEIEAIAVDKTRQTKLKAFQTKLAGLTFLDPACGSGNFLTETYISLRRLENRVIEALEQGQVTLGHVTNPIQISISQFHGIEINDFAVTVAKTALWIAESQMMKETEEIVRHELDFLPLKTAANIVEGNALRIDWETVVPKNELDYIMGNPPFVGYSLQNSEQKADILSIYVDEKGKPYKTAGKIDYVSGWYFKAAQLMQETKIRTAFVSTNSITQGEQVAGVWKPLYERFGVHIDFAHRTFRWDNRGEDKDGKRIKTDKRMAAVHCVIVGFSIAPNHAPKVLFTSERPQIVENINAYLFNAEDLFVESCNRALCDIPEISKGFQATDNGYLILNEDEKKELLKMEPNAEKWIRPYSMGVEFINNIPRYCLWLVDITPNELRKLPAIKKRVEECREWRYNAKPSGDAFKLKDVPHLFRPCKQFKDVPYIAIPLVSSEFRRYVPMGFINNGMIPGNNLFSVFNAEIYHFGILTSNVHMAWMRAVGGRLKSDYRYSSGVVYNSFPWPTPTDAQKGQIEQTAQAILDARALYPEASLADLYDETTMPPELRKAHRQNDKAVMQAYGFDVKTTTEASCVAELMKMYQKLTEGTHEYPH